MGDLPWCAPCRDSFDRQFLEPLRGSDLPWRTAVVRMAGFVASAAAEWGAERRRERETEVG